MFHLEPVRYSKSKKSYQIVANLKKAPKQLCNSSEAFAGFVMEFRPKGQPDAPVGTLSEYLDTGTDFSIHTEDGYILKVDYKSDEKIFRVYDKEYGVNIDVNIVDDDNIEIKHEDYDKLEAAVTNAKVDLIVENDGIGPYEFWGFQGNHKGSDYAVIDSQICTRLVLNIKIGTLTEEEDVKIIWNEIADNIIVEQNFSKSGGCDDTHDGWEFDLECKLVASEFKLESATSASLLLTWEEK